MTASEATANTRYGEAFEAVRVLPRGVFHALTLGVVGVCGLHFWSNSYILTDDAFIYLRVMENLLQGHGPVYNAGDSFAPVTSTFWAYAGCAAHRVLPFDLLLSVKVLSVVLYVLTLLLLTDVFRTAIGDAALLTGPAILSIPLFRVLIGLETFLALFAIALSMWAYFRARSLVLVAVCVAFGFFCRGDTVLVALPLAMHLLFKQGVHDGVRKALPALLVGFVVLCAGLVMHYSLSGTWLPPTMHTKMLQGAVGPWPTYASRALKYVSHDPEILYPLAFLGMLWLRAPGMTLLSAALLHWVAYAVMSVADYPWYAYQLLTFVRLAEVIGLFFAAWSTARALLRLVSGQGGRFAPACAALALGLTLVGLNQFGLLNQDALRSLDVSWNTSRTVGDAGYMRTYVEVAQRIRADLDGGSDGRPVLLGAEIGIIGYRCLDVTVRDVNGLATPHLDPATLNNWEALAQRFDPDYLVMMGQQHPETLLLPNASYDKIYSVQHSGHAGAVLYRRAAR